ncbi:putative lipoyltransferase 2, mitochondrial [Geranomyces michiganensis]|nr:putative lipoyltransferase 2, mitochondrial [Geranomyces michiganensis]
MLRPIFQSLRAASEADQSGESAAPFGFVPAISMRQYLDDYPGRNDEDEIYVGGFVNLEFLKAASRKHGLNDGGTFQFPEPEDNESSLGSNLLTWMVSPNAITLPSGLTFVDLVKGSGPKFAKLSRRPVFEYILIHRGVTNMNMSSPGPVAYAAETLVAGLRTTLKGMHGRGIRKAWVPLRMMSGEGALRGQILSPPIAVKHVVTPVPYSAALALQDHLVTLRTQRRTPNILLLLQHPPTFTAGRRVRGTDHTEGKRLRATGAEYYETMRGGQTTFHGPGQLVGYPILHLPDFGVCVFRDDRGNGRRDEEHVALPGLKAFLFASTFLQLGVRTYIEHLETVLITALHAYGITATTTADTGVWVSSSSGDRNDSDSRNAAASGSTTTSRERKIAALGIQVRRHVSSHGFALNCDTDLAWFDHIVPCGLVGKGVTSISHELDSAAAARAAVSPPNGGVRHTRVTVADAIPHLVNAFGSVFDSSVFPLAEMDRLADQNINDFIAAKLGTSMPKSSNTEKLKED